MATPEKAKPATVNSEPALNVDQLGGQIDKTNSNLLPKVKAKSGGRSPKAKGSRCELETTRLLQSHGLDAVKVPLSGALGGAHSGDVKLSILGRTLTIECKSRKRFDTLHNWLRNRDLLVLRANHQVGLVVLPIDLFAELASKAEGER
jgi:hypothetical protein